MEFVLLCISRAQHVSVVLFIPVWHCMTYGLRTKAWGAFLNSRTASKNTYIMHTWEKNKLTILRETSKLNEITLVKAGSLAIHVYHLCSIKVKNVMNTEKMREANSERKPGTDSAHHQKYCSVVARGVPFMVQLSNLISAALPGSNSLPFFIFSYSILNLKAFSQCSYKNQPKISLEKLEHQAPRTT